MLLPDIERGHSWSEDYRRECEARMVIRMSAERRMDYIDRIESRRGKAAADLLMKTIRSLPLSR